MRIKMVLFFLLVLYEMSIVQAQDCYPNSNGYFKIYGNLKIDHVDDDFSKQDLLSLIAEYENESENLNTRIAKVSKSFPSAVGEFLQKTVSIYTKDRNLYQSLKKYRHAFGLVEFICEPKNKLLYEPNDYSGASFNHKSHLELVNAKEAFDITHGDSRILIGITDSHIEETHDDLKNKIHQVLQNSPGNDFHGTHVSGCAAADTDNGTGISSTGFNSEIVFSSNWASEDELLEIAQISGVRVINCSWINSCSYSETDKMVYDEIRDVHNVIVVAGAGNNSTHCGDNAYVYPAAYESVISVTSVGHGFDVGHVSPVYGAVNWKDCHEEIIGDVSSTHHHNDKVNICAPGYNVLSTAPKNKYAGSWGTSFASPMVAGVCALVASVNPCLNASEIQEIVLDEADPSIYVIPENSDYIGKLGTGRVDAEAAVNEALRKSRVFIQNENIYSTKKETSETDIYAGSNVNTAVKGGNVVLKAGSDVTFEATHKIVFSSGFKVENSATFKASIYESNCF